MYKKEVINEMNELSLKIFGSKSRWRKILERGETEVLEKEEIVYIPDEKDELIPVSTKVPDMHVGSKGGKITKLVHTNYTIDSLRAAMLVVKARQEEYIAAMIKQQHQKEEEAKRKQIIEDASGSVF